MSRVELPTPMRTLMRDEPNEEQLQRMWQDIEARGPSARHWPVAGLALGASVLVAVLFLWRSPNGGRTQGPLRQADGRALVIAAHGVTELSDGSSLNLGEHTELEVLANSDSVFALALRRGHAAFSVEPGGPRGWRIECGALTVEVVGTIFSVARSERNVEVAVERGAVIIRGEGVPDQVRRVIAGERISVPVPEQLQARPARLPDATGVEAGSEAAASLGAVEENVSSEPETAASEAGAVSHRATTSKRAMPSAPVVGDADAEADADADTVKELLYQADVLRLQSDVRGAARLLDNALRLHSDDKHSALAALTLGRIYLDSLNEPERGVWALERALEIGGLPDALEENTYERLVTTLRKMGDSKRAAMFEREQRLRFPEPGSQPH